MSRVIYDLWTASAPDPKRGDLMQSNIGDRRERTWIIARVRRIKRKDESACRRFEITLYRWWTLSVKARHKLCASQMRSLFDVQSVFTLYRTKREKLSFEKYMRRTSCPVIGESSLTELSITLGCLSREQRSAQRAANETPITSATTSSRTGRRAMRISAQHASCR